MKNPPLELDPILLRYLRDIEFRYDQRQNAECQEDDFLKRNRLLIDRFEKGEDVDHETEKRFEKFTSYFEKKKALRFTNFYEYWERYLQGTSTQPILFLELKDPYLEIEYTPYLYIEVLDIDAIRRFRKKYADYEDSVSSSSTAKLVTGDDAIFDKGVLHFRGRQYKPTSIRRQDLLKILWQERKARGKKARPLTPSEIACRLYNLDSGKDATDKQMQYISSDIKGINYQLKNNGFPVKIRNVNDKVQIHLSKSTED